MTDATIIREPLTYYRHGPHSYFKDLAMRELHNDPEAASRLQRHGREIRSAVMERDLRAAMGVPGSYEVRVPANWTPGTGGDFAPPAWMVQDFAAVPRPGRVLAKMVPHFDLPVGAQSINLPRTTAGTVMGSTGLDEPAPTVDLAEQAVQSPVVTIAGNSDFPLAMLEQSPLGAPLDWAMFVAMEKAYDAQLEAQLLNGGGAPVQQILGLINVPGLISVPYTSGSPTGSGLYPVLGQALAQTARARQEPPECWLLNTGRWAWLATSEDAQGLPFGLANHEGLDPIGSIAGFPAHLDEAIPVLGGGAEPMVACKPSDLMLFESVPRTGVMFEPLSGTLGVRLQLRRYVAGVTGRYPSGIAVVQGSGLVPVAGF